MNFMNLETFFTSITDFRRGQGLRFELSPLLRNNFDGAFARIDRFKNLLLNQQDYTYYQQYIDTIEHITPDELLRLAQTHLKTDDMFTVVVGN